MCGTCGGSRVVRRGGFDHSGQVEWVEPCACTRPPQSPLARNLDSFFSYLFLIVVGGAVAVKFLFFQN